MRYFFKNLPTKIIFILFLTVFNKTYLYAGYGSGDLNISGKALEWFIQYIKNPGGKKNPRNAPMKFSVSLDGKNAWYYHCLASNATRCQSVSDTLLNKQCEKNSYGSKCEVFAVGRIIKWRNGTSKNKKIRFKRSDSRQEIIAKLSELNFIQKDESQKSEKKIKSLKKDLSTQLIEITNLYKSGALSEEDYLKAKNKLLSD